MTAPELKPCPFCGGKPEKIELTDDANAGGGVIQCTDCLASSHVEFGRKENLVSAWNTRTSTIPDPMDDPRVVALVGAAKIMIEGVDAGYYKNNPAFKDLRAALSTITKEPPHEQS